MAKHRIRRWFQFGILDLLIVTAIVGVVAVLLRPIQAETSPGLPWVFGVWKNAIDEKPTSAFSLGLLPDGFFGYVALDGPSELSGKGWKLAREGQSRGRHVLLCGEKRFVMRRESDGWLMELLDDDGKVQSRLRQRILVEGPFSDGAPNGLWKVVDLGGEGPAPTSLQSLTYQNGELIDAHNRMAAVCWP